MTTISVKQYIGLLLAAFVIAIAPLQSQAAVIPISTLPSGGTVQTGDAIPASRAGTTYKVTVGSAATQSTGNFLQVGNNLSDVANAVTARTNLGLGTAATAASTSFAQSITLNTPSLLYSTPVTFSNTSGAFAGTLTLNTQLANTFLAGPTSGSAATPTMRTLVAADVPTLNQSTTGQAGTVATINGLITAGSNVTITGSGTSGSPYSVAASGTPVSVTAASPNIVVTPSPGTGTFTIGATDLINAQGTAASYTILASDMAKTITHTRSSSMADALPQAGTTGFEAGKSFSEINIGTGVLTITPTTSTINGASTLTLNQNQSAYLISDGTNYVAFLGAGSITTPVSVANGGTGIASGTSGGIPAFTASGTIASSGALTANAPVIGGGAGAVPTVGTRSGNTTTFATATGTLTSGHCVSIDASGNFVDAGGACTTGGGGGTVTSGTAGQLTYYASTGTTVVGNANLTVSSGALTLGQATSVQGSVILSGSTSGATTLAGPVSGGGTQTFQAGSDTIVGRATTDTLTNKSLTSPTITGTGTFQILNGAKSLTAGVVALTPSAGAIATDASQGNHFRVTPTHSAATTMSAPTNPTDGQKITYELVQDSTGSGTITWNAVFNFGTSGAPTLTTTASKRDIVGFVYSSDAVKWLYLGSQLNF